MARILVLQEMEQNASDVFDFARAVKRHPELRDIPLVFYYCAVSTFARPSSGGAH